jgi:inorganic pyrophosphatase
MAVDTFKVLVEIPAGSAVKYEIDEETGELTVDRFLHTAFVYPFNYGFIKDTIGEDKDPMDALVLSSQQVHPGVVIKCHAVGMLEMEDEEGIDTKIIAVPVAKVDPYFGEFSDINDVPQAILNKIKHFFENYKSLEPGKWVKVKDFKNRSEAENSIEKSFVK